jgi:hypothetical protein
MDGICCVNTKIMSIQQNGIENVVEKLGQSTVTLLHINA